jgi:putative sterol carrier protein
MSQYARLKKLTGTGVDTIQGTIQRAASLVGTTKEQCVVKIKIVGKEGKSWSVDLQKGPEVQSRSVRKPTLEIITKAATWWTMADGRLSPVEAFLNGNLRFRGDEKIAQRLLRRLSGRKGKTEC